MLWLLRKAAGWTLNCIRLYDLLQIHPNASERSGQRFPLQMTVIYLSKSNPSLLESKQLQSSAVSESRVLNSTDTMPQEQAGNEDSYIKSLAEHHQERNPVSSDVCLLQTSAGHWLQNRWCLEPAPFPHFRCKLKLPCLAFILLYSLLFRCN